MLGECVFAMVLGRESVAALVIANGVVVLAGGLESRVVAKCKAPDLIQ
jgi:hypothetical protein